MTQLSEQDIRACVSGVTDPFTDDTLNGDKQLMQLEIQGGLVKAELQLSYPSQGLAEEVKQLVVAALKNLPGVKGVELALSHKILARKIPQGIESNPEVKNIIAIASGKGGVGKSTTAVNLALALQREGAKVGILDADIYGPSQPQMLGSYARPDVIDGDQKKIVPLASHGLQSISIGNLVDSKAAMVWRGPMATSALDQLWRDTQWQGLDYLLIDLPPGTGDIQLTLAQRIPVAGAVIITTPQDISLLDAVRGLKMFEKVKVPVLGVIENMAVHVCSNCGHEEHIFGSGGGQKMVAEHNMELLGSLPLDIRIREQADGGKPSVIAEPDSDIALTFRKIALRMAGRLAKQNRDFSTKFPKITVIND